jgi:hypothetical protein
MGTARQNGNSRLQMANSRWDGRKSAARQNGDSKLQMANSRRDGRKSTVQ